MSLSHILLGFLREPASGYDLKRTFERSVRHFWSAELSQIYPTLKRMEAEGWLSSTTEPSARGPDRRVYATTPAGCAELERWLAGGPSLGTERFAYLAQLFFMDALDDPAVTLDFMRALRDRLAVWRAELEAIEAEIERRAPGFPDQLPDRVFNQHATLRMGLHTLSARLAWCDETIDRLNRRMAGRASVRETAGAVKEA